MENAEKGAAEVEKGDREREAKVERRGMKRVREGFFSERRGKRGWASAVNGGPCRGER